MIKEKIKELTVQIITPKERGTGVLVVYKNNPCVLTVHHCIYGKGSVEQSIDADEVKFVLHNRAELYAIDIETIGELVLLKLNPKDLSMNHLTKVIFAHVEYTPTYYVRGFPSAFNEAHNFNATCNEIERERFKIEIEGLTKDTSGEDALEYMRGVSGSGVFFAKDKKLYLVGLVNALANQSGTFNAVYCLNLRKLLKAKPKKKRRFKVMWLIELLLVLVVGILAFFFYSNSSESEALTPKKKAQQNKESTKVKPSIPPSHTKKSISHNQKENNLSNVGGMSVLKPMKAMVYPKNVTVKPIKAMVYPKNVTVKPIDNTKTSIR